MVVVWATWNAFALHPNVNAQCLRHRLWSAESWPGAQAHRTAQGALAALSPFDSLGRGSVDAALELAVQLSTLDLRAAEAAGVTVMLLAVSIEQFEHQTV